MLPGLYRLGRGAKQTTLRSLCLLSETTTRTTTRPAIAFLVQILQLIAIKTRHSTNDCLWRKRLENKKADARVAVNADPTNSTSSINIASNKSDNAIMTIHPMPDFNANTNFFNCRYSS